MTAVGSSIGAAGSGGASAGTMTGIDVTSVPQNGRFTTMSRLCEPSCADGGGRFETWRYDRTKAEFVVTASVSCAHFDEACTFPWRDRQTLGSLR